MSPPRGREARLRKEFAALYGGVDADVWMPVERWLRHVTNLIRDDRSKSGVITGPRLLRDEHFDFRGVSARPVGLPDRSTRLSDAGAEPPPSGVADREQDKEGESSNE